jgi:hypothetical protein
VLVISIGHLGERKMPAHFLLRIGDGNHFNSSSVKSIWGINSVYPASKMFISSVQEGDLL